MVIIKGTFRLGSGSEQPEPHPEPEPVCLAPVYQGEPGRSSLLREAEMVAEHPGTDVTLIGSAHAPGGQPVAVLDVGLRVGETGKTVRVFGDRVWDSGIFSPRISDPRPFVTMPLCYERAFGGRVVHDSDGEIIEEDPRNPVGKGLYLRARDAIGQPLPNLEDPAEPIQGWDQRPRPSGFGPVPPGWSPRKELAGTFDGRW